MLPTKDDTVTLSFTIPVTVYLFACWIILDALMSPSDFLKELFNKIFQEYYIVVSNSLDPDQD